MADTCGNFWKKHESLCGTPQYTCKEGVLTLGSQVRKAGISEKVQIKCYNVDLKYDNIKTLQGNGRAIYRESYQHFQVYESVQYLTALLHISCCWCPAALLHRWQRVLARTSLHIDNNLIMVRSWCYVWQEVRLSWITQQDRQTDRQRCYSHVGNRNIGSTN